MELTPPQAARGLVVEDLADPRIHDETPVLVADFVDGPSALSLAQVGHTKQVARDGSVEVPSPRDDVGTKELAVEHPVPAVA